MRSRIRTLRGISERALDDFRKLEATAFFRRFVDAGRLVATREVPAVEVPLPDAEKARWSGFLEHEPVPVISYAYEWTFGMLQEAAVLTLDLLEAAIGADLTLKDATPYNVQFVAGQPVFIDIPSFETLQPGATWSGYRQFCEMFLFPLMLQAYKGIDIQPMMRARIDGVGIQTMARMLGVRDRFRKGVFSHVWLQAKLDRRFGSTTRDVKSELKSAGFSKELILANVRKTRKLVRKLSWGGEGSEWGGYEAFHNYSESDHALKEQFVEDCVRNSGASTVWDIGANTGQFARIAARHADRVLAMDIDHYAVERMYRRNVSEEIENILPLVQNVCDPSPNWGWRNRERSDLVSRAKPDLVLCLALIHHVVITANVPLDEFVEWLAGLTEQLVIEYVARADDKVQALLRNKEDKYDDYSRENLEAALARHFEIRQRLSLESGNRFLYWCSRRA
ncbi:MAG: class I SAM-dependent methyltransferase [Xanthomonadales bacterium]